MRRFVEEELLFYVLVLLALIKPLGLYMVRVYEEEFVGLDRVLGPIEGLLYRLCGTSPGAEMVLRDNLLLYGLGGLITPFIGIKLIDALLVVFGLT